MLAAATTTTQPYSLSHLPVNWFDLVLVIILVFGFLRGRKNGMSKECLPLIEWLAAVTLATLFYQQVTDLLVNVANLKRATGTYILAYVGIACVVFFIFYFIKHSLKPKVGGSGFFGGGEYYLGMFSGFLRYACIVTFFLAILNAPIYSESDINSIKAYNKKNFGGGLYEGNYLPDIPTIQSAVFKESFLGPYIKNYGDPLLIHTDEGGGYTPHKKPAIAGSY